MIIGGSLRTAAFNIIVMKAVLLQFNRPAIKVDVNNIASIQPHGDMLVEVWMKDQVRILCYNIKFE